MPTSPGHDRPLPTGRDLARVLRALFARQQGEVLARLARGNREPPRLAHWTGPMVDVMVPLVTPLVARGGADAARRIAAMAAPRLRAAPGYSGRGGAWVELRVKRAVPTAFDVYNPKVTEFIRRMTFDFLDAVNDTSADLLRRALRAGLEGGETLAEITARVQGVFAEPARALTVAATEASRALHGGQYLAAQESGVVGGKEWVASGDACAICRGLAAKGVIGLDEDFAVIGRGPYARIPYPPAHPRCFCSYTLTLG